MKFLRILRLFILIVCMVLLCGCELQIKHNEDDSVNVPQENVSIEYISYNLNGTRNE